MKYFKSIFFLSLIFVLSSCYHAQITTDKNPSSTVIEDKWADSFVYGLVPPNTVETASKCPNGLAKVETRISFLNGLVSALTFSIYTPMHITVTCAAGPGTALLDTDNNTRLMIKSTASDKEKEKSFKEATNRSVKTGKAVYVMFE